jgi:CDP-diglyceride synthetase
MPWRAIKEETDVLEACEEMKTRIISGAAAIILLAAVVYAGRIAIGLAVFLLAAVGIYEFSKASEKGGFKPVYAAGFLYALTQHLDLEVAGKIGSLLAGNVVEVMGAKLPDKTWERLLPQIEVLKQIGTTDKVLD